MVESAAMGNERLVELYQTLLQRKAEMPEDSSTTRLLREGSPGIIAKGTEELGEFFQALLEQGDEEVNLECSQTSYYILVFMVAQDKGDIREVVTELDSRESKSLSLPTTLGLAIRICAENMGKTYSTLLSPTSTNADVNSSVVRTFWSFRDAIEVAGKGSWGSVLDKI